MAFTGVNKSTDNFRIKLYTGNGGTQSVTYDESGNMQPDFVWCKKRNLSEQHVWFDVNRGVEKIIESDTQDAQETHTDSLKSFDTNGFSFGGMSRTNANSHTYVSMSFKAGGTGSANTAGTINSTVSVNAAAGVSIVKYTGNGVANATIGHGLNDTIACIILKNLSDSENWWVYHKGLSDPATKAINLNNTNAEFTPGTSAFYPTSFSNTVFSVKNDNASNSNGDDYIAYVYAEKPGFSSFGSYTGNGDTDGPFIPTNFAPHFVIVKCTSHQESWYMTNNKTPEYNGPLAASGVRELLYPNASGAANATIGWMNLYSNGFKMGYPGADTNGSGRSYLYSAFGSTIVGTNNVAQTAK